MKKKLALFILMIICTTSIFGCGDASSELMSTFNSEMSSTIAARGQQNIEIAKMFRQLKMLNDKDIEAIEKNINKQVEIAQNHESMQEYATYLSKKVTMYTLGGNGAPNTLQASIDDTTVDLNWDGSGWGAEDVVLTQGAPGVNLKVPVDNNNQANDWDEDDLENLPPSAFIISNYLHSNQYKELTNNMVPGGVYVRGSEETQEVPHVGWIKDKVEPLPFIEENIANKLNEVTKIEVYVLKPDISVTFDNDLEGLMSEIKIAINSDNSRDYLSKYFERAQDITENGNGKYVNLIENDNKTWNIVDISKPHAGNDEHDNVVGYDMVLGQDELTNAVHIQCYEFSDFARQLYQQLFTGDGIPRYYLDSSGDGIKAYLIEYPISVIDGMYTSEDGKSVECDFKSSGLGVNLVEGTYVKYKANDDGTFDTSEATTIGKDSSNGFYLTLDETGNNDDSSNTSLALKGYAANIIKTIGSGYSGSADNISQTIIANGNDHVVLTGRIVLRDYLEGTYAPDFQQDKATGNYGEPEVVFGRKIRFNTENDKWQTEDATLKVVTSEGDEYVDNTKHNQKLVYSKTDTDVAYFVDQSGAKVDSAPALSITEFCDIEYLEKPNVDDRAVITLNGIGESGDMTNGHESTSRTIGEIDTLQHIVIENGGTSNYHNEAGDTYKIHVTDVFPGPNIGVYDYEHDDEQKQRMYVMATKSGLFKTSLYSGWINSSSETGSLKWWQGYLTDNNFNYTIDSDTTNEYINANYKLGQTQSNVTQLNLGTLDKINEMYAEEDKDYTLSIMKTIFMIGGWVIIIYSAVLMLLWAIDVNSGLGIQLLEKATFGNWVAVKYEDDIPIHDENGTHYMTFKRISLRCMIMIGIGLILIYVNMFWLVLQLIRIFGKLGQSIQDIISGTQGQV